MADFRPMNKESVVDEVLRQMMEKIADGTWVKGEKIPSENELREQLCVSRDTVRQAIKQLCAQGLLESHQGKGTFVRDADMSLYLTNMIPLVFLSEDDGSNLIQFMQLIQAASAGLAAEKATEEEIDFLQTCLDHMTEEEGNDKVYYDWDSKFHVQLSRCSRNPLFVRSIEITSDMLAYYFTDLARIHGHDDSIAQHSRCLEAIRARDVNAARSAMKEHYDMLGQRLRKIAVKKKAL